MSGLDVSRARTESKQSLGDVWRLAVGCQKKICDPTATIPPISLANASAFGGQSSAHSAPLTVSARFGIYGVKYQELSGTWRWRRQGAMEVENEPPIVDYEFRPKSFWTAASHPLAAILRNVKGRNRREMIWDYFETGKLDQLSDELLKDTLSDEARASLGKIHPTFMGGEYLPNYGRQEVEIARIELASTTSDVISLRARPSGSRIKYRVVDEYQTEFLPPP
jgi:hypothetical protein